MKRQKKSFLHLLTVGVISLAQQVHAEIVSLDCKLKSEDEVITLHIDTDAGLMQKGGTRFALTVTPDEYISEKQVGSDQDGSTFLIYWTYNINRHTGEIVRTYMHVLPTTKYITDKGMCEKRRKQVPKF